MDRVNDAVELLNPDCVAGKHHGCAGDAWDFGTDRQVACACKCHLLPLAEALGDTGYLKVLEFDYKTPPLTANQRMHWRLKASITKSVRAAAYLSAYRIPALGHCRVSLVWIVTTKHRRDADNLVPTLKAMCDGLVDAGIVADDIPSLMAKEMPTIRYEEGGTPRMLLTVESWDGRE